MQTTSLTWPALANILGDPQQNPRQVLQQWYSDGRLEKELPEVYVLFGIPQPPEHHPEIDTGLHTLMVVEQAWMIKPDASIVFAALVHDLGKALTSPDHWPKHVDHEGAGVPLVDAVCSRLGVPAYTRELAVWVCEQHLKVHRVFERRPGSIIKWMAQEKILTNAQLRADALIACEADARGRTGLENREYLNPVFIERIGNIAQQHLDAELSQIPLQQAISAIKKYFGSFDNKEHVKSVLRSEIAPAEIELAP